MCGNVAAAARNTSTFTTAAAISAAADWVARRARLSREIRGRVPGRRRAEAAREPTALRNRQQEDPLSDVQGYRLVPLTGGC